jgi:glyoxylase-like metal-dependent hydrolase (beta-lactamase superfamily II)
MRRSFLYTTSAIVLLMLGAAVAGLAQNMQYNTRGDAGMTAQYVKTGLFVISGRGSNSVLRLSANGLILVDGKLPGGYDALMAQVKRVSKQPVRALILTDCAASHTGTNAKFVDDGDGTRIVAQEDVKQDLGTCNLAGDTLTPAIDTYGRDYQIRLGGVEAQLLHFGKAYSSSDTVVYFPNLKAVAVGDLFASVPDPNYSAGGSLVGWGPVLAQVLKLDFDVAIPSTGPTIGRADLEAFKAKIDTLVSRATRLVNTGVAKDQLMSQLKTDDLGWQLTFTPDQVDHFYAELSHSEQPVHEAQLGHQPASK